MSIETLDVSIDAIIRKIETRLDKEDYDGAATDLRKTGEHMAKVIVRKCGFYGVLDGKSYNAHLTVLETFHLVKKEYLDGVFRQIQSLGNHGSHIFIA